MISAITSSHRASRENEVGSCVVCVGCYARLASIAERRRRRVRRRTRRCIPARLGHRHQQSGRGVPLGRSASVGAQVGGTVSGADFHQARQARWSPCCCANLPIPNERHVSGWTPLGKADTTSGQPTWRLCRLATTAQWDAAVLGVEGNYNRTSLTMSQNGSGRMGSPAPIWRPTATLHPYSANVTVNAGSNIHITISRHVRVRTRRLGGRQLPAVRVRRSCTWSRMPTSAAP